MKCLYCGGKTRVTNSRPQQRNNQIWRRRQCLKCKALFTSHEAIELESSLFIDRQGHPEPFLADLLFMDMLLALSGHKQPYLAAREATDTVTRRLLRSRNQPYFEPTEVSRAAAAVLSKLDRQAYLRFVAEHSSLQG